MVARLCRLSQLRSIFPFFLVGSLMLVTGATGFVASHVIRQFLHRGYKVRGTVRDLAQASWLVDDNFKSYAESGHFEPVVVPDLAANDAFDEAVKRVSAIAHIASVVGFDPNPNNVVPQTVAGVNSILTATAKEPSVREIAFTSSIAVATMLIAAQDASMLIAAKNAWVDRNTWNEMAVQAFLAPPPYEPSRVMFTYAASKVAAEKALWQFVEEKKPHYNVSAICPFAITGEPFHLKHVEAFVNWVTKIFKEDKASLDPYFACQNLVQLFQRAVY